MVEFDDIIRFVADLIEKAMPMRAKAMFISVENPTTMLLANKNPRDLELGVRSDR